MVEPDSLIFCTVIALPGALKEMQLVVLMTTFVGVDELPLRITVPPRAGAEIDKPAVYVPSAS